MASWFGSKVRALRGCQRRVPVPRLEQLERRVLLSADTGLSCVVDPCQLNDDQTAIYVDLTPGTTRTIAQVEAPTSVQSAQPSTQLDSRNPVFNTGIEVAAVLPGQEQASIAQASGPKDLGPAGQVEAAAEVDGAAVPPLGLEAGQEDSMPGVSQTDAPGSSQLTAAQIRGPPAGAEGYSTTLTPCTYTVSDGIFCSSDTQGLYPSLTREIVFIGPSVDGCASLVDSGNPHIRDSCPGCRLRRYPADHQHPLRVPQPLSHPYRLPRCTGSVDPGHSEADRLFARCIRQGPSYLGAVPVCGRRYPALRLFHCPRQGGCRVRGPDRSPDRDGCGCVHRQHWPARTWWGLGTGGDHRADRGLAACGGGTGRC